MRVATINIWQHFGDWPARRRELAEWIALLRPDVVCMQEVAGGAREQNQAVAVARDARVSQLGYSVVHWAPEKSAHQVGLAVLTRSAIEFTSRFHLPGDKDADPVERCLLGVRTSEAMVYCTHLSPHSHLSHLRSAQVAAITDIIGRCADRSRGTLSLLAGDFNAGPESAEIRALTSQYADCWSPGLAGDGATWTADNPYLAGMPDPPLRFDYILVVAPHSAIRQSGIRAQLAFHKPLTGVFASDHFGVVADVTQQGNSVRHQA